MSFEETCFLCRVFDEGDSASSSPEASRDDGWRRSAVDDLSWSEGVILFLFPELVEEGEDMVLLEFRVRS